MTASTAPARLRAHRRPGDAIFSGAALAGGLVILVALAAVAIFLIVQSLPAFGAKTTDITSTGEYANFWAYVGPLAFGTVWAALLALLFAVPFSIAIALFTSHYAPRRIARGLGAIIDLLAAIPSVVYGAWGIFVFAPFVQPFYTFLNDTLGWFPLFSGNVSASGRTILTVAMVLGVMVIPIITALSREIFLQTPRLNEEAALALGATRWEMIQMAVLPFGRAGIVSAVMLGLGRALGETLAVAMVLSPSVVVSFFLLRTENPTTVAANIALQFPESFGTKLSVLIATGLILFVITFAVNAASRAIVGRRAGGKGIEMATTALAPNNLRAGQLPRYSPVGLLILSLVVTGALFLIFLLAGMTTAYNVTGAIFFGLVLWVVAIYVASFLVEGSRRAKDRLVTAVVCTAFGIALLPLISLLVTVISRGVARFDVAYFSESMRGVTDSGGGAIHAVIGTVEITLAAAVISVPVGLLAAIYLVEYGRGAIARGITFLVDVMTGIPLIVAGLFAFALFELIAHNAGYRSGFGGSVALSLLMIPIVVRSSEEMLKLVPMELREASYALGVPKWLTVTKVVLPTALAGIVTGVMLAIARVIGETAPLLIVSGFTDSVNYNLFDQRMASLPVFVYTQLTQPGPNTADFFNRAWAGALTLILIVLLLNVLARFVARFFAPKMSSR